MRPLVREGALVLQGRQALSVRTDGRRCTEIVTGTEQWRETLQADGIILATGRFLGGGTRSGSRRYRGDAFSGFRSHSLPTEASGIAANSWIIAAIPSVKPAWRSTTVSGRWGRTVAALLKNLFAAGSVLAHQDWVRTKSGAGLAISTARGAVEAYLRLRSGD